MERMRGSALWGRLLGAVTIALVSSPAYLGNGPFGQDYNNHLWVAGYQAQAISNTGLPTYFLHTNDVFEPFYAFYGGTLYAIAGYLSVVFGGEPRAAYVVLMVIGLAMAYGGIVWIGRLLGLRGLIAHVPAVVAVTSPYLLTDLFARGAWTEFMALSALPLLVAGALYRLRVDKWRVLPFLATCWAAIIFTGSHNITLLWGSVWLAVLALGLLVLNRRSVSWRAVISAAWPMVLGVGVNGWFLLTDLRFSSRTIAGGPPETQDSFRFTESFNSLGALFDPLRDTPPGSTTQGLVVAAPILGLGWAVVLGLTYWRRNDVDRRRLWAFLLLLTTGMIALTMWNGFWLSLGRPFSGIQYAFRINGYVLFVCAGLLIAALRMVSGSGRRLVSSSLGLLVLFSMLPAVWQVWRVDDDPLPTQRPVSDALRNGYEVKPSTWYDVGLYADGSRRIVATTRVASIPAPEPGTDRVTADVVIPPGTGPVALNVQGGSYVVAIEGAERVGRTEDGRAVIAAADSSTSRQRTITVRRADNRTVTLAPLVSLAALIALLASVVTLAVRNRRRDSATTTPKGKHRREPSADGDGSQDQVPVTTSANH